MEDKKVVSDLLKKIEEEGQDILALGKPISALFDSELGALLLWYTKEAKSTQGLKATNLIKWNMIVAEGTQPPLLESCTTENEAELERLKKKDTKMWGHCVRSAGGTEEEIVDSDFG